MMKMPPIHPSVAKIKFPIIIPSVCNEIIKSIPNDVYLEYIFSGFFTKYFLLMFLYISEAIFSYSLLNSAFC